MSTTPADRCALCNADTVSCFYREDERDLYSCTTCGVVFAWPMAAGTQDTNWEEKYSQQLRDGNGILDTHRARDPIFHNFFQSKPMRNTTGRVLDIGCADGHFLTIARDYGWDAVGVDMSKAAIDFATEHHRLEAYHADVLDPSFAPERFDLITFWDVLEHLPRPVDFLARARDLLNPGGRIFIRVPNLPYLWLKYYVWTKLLRHPKCFIPLVHWYNFNRRSMEYVLGQASLTPLRFRAGKPEVYGSPARRTVQHGFGTLARLASVQSPFCFALEVFARTTR